MKMNAGVITHRLEESKKFYRDILHFGIVFENDFYILLHTPGGGEQLSFLQPGHPSQQPIFQPAFEGKGMFLTIEVEDVNAEYARIIKLGIPLAIDLREEPWGDKHFAIEDPNGIGIDIVQYTAAPAP